MKSADLPNTKAQYWHDLGSRGQLNQVYGGLWVCLGTVPRAECPPVTRRPWGSCTVAVALTVHPAIPLRSPGSPGYSPLYPQDVLLALHIHVTTVQTLWAPGATLASLPIPLQPLGLAQKALGPSSATGLGPHSTAIHWDHLCPSAFLMDWFLLREL